MKRKDFMVDNFLTVGDMSSIDNKLMLYFGRPTEDTYSQLYCLIRFHRVCGRDIVRLLSYPSNKLSWFSSLNSFLTMVGQSFDKGLTVRTFWNAVNSLTFKEML